MAFCCVAVQGHSKKRSCKRLHPVLNPQTLLNANNCYIKDKRCIGWNRYFPLTLSLWAICKRTRNNQTARTTRSYPYQAFIPALNYLPLPQGNRKRLPTIIIGAIKFLTSALQPSSIDHGE